VRQFGQFLLAQRQFGLGRLDLEGDRVRQELGERPTFLDALAKFDRVLDDAPVDGAPNSHSLERPYRPNERLPGRHLFLGHLGRHNRGLTRWLRRRVAARRTE
jgi:hypothetical protein